MLGALVGEARASVGGMLFRNEDRREVLRMVPAARRPCPASPHAPDDGVEFADGACVPRKMHIFEGITMDGIWYLQFWCAGVWFPEVGTLSPSLICH